MTAAKIRFEEIHLNPIVYYSPTRSKKSRSFTILFFQP